MKKIFLVICSLFMFNLVFAADTKIADLEAEIAALEKEVADAENIPSISDFAGIYKGLGPTQGSKIGVGELYLEFSEGKLLTRMATGIDVNEQTLDVEFEYLSPKKLEIIFKEDAKSFEGQTVFASNADGSPPLYVFLNDSDSKEPQLIVIFHPNSVMGRSIVASPLAVAPMLGFYSESQSEIYYKNIKLSEGKLPLLSNGGKATNE